MPMDFSRTTGIVPYTDPFLSAEGATQKKIDTSTLTTDFVDDKGYLRPGTPFQEDGTLYTGAANTLPFYFNREAVKLPGRTGNTNLGSDTTDPIIAMVTRGLINRDIWKDNIGRDLSANELTNMKGSGFKTTNT